MNADCEHSEGGRLFHILINARGPEKLIFFAVVGLEASLSSFLEGVLYKFSKPMNEKIMKGFQIFRLHCEGSERASIHLSSAFKAFSATRESISHAEVCNRGLQTSKS